jgi:hypothetical protein
LIEVNQPLLKPRTESSHADLTRYLMDSAAGTLIRFCARKRFPSPGNTIGEINIAGLARDGERERNQYVRGYRPRSILAQGRRGTNSDHFNDGIAGIEAIPEWTEQVRAEPESGTGDDRRRLDQPANGMIGRSDAGEGPIRGRDWSDVPIRGNSAPSVRQRPSTFGLHSCQGKFDIGQWQESGCAQECGAQAVEGVRRLARQSAD